MNGWRNRATWLVNLWFEPTTKRDIDFLEETIQNEFNEMLGLHNRRGTTANFYADLIDFTAIDWDELRDAMEDEEE
tara:strand:- start:9 stop:236 length:228 start_codon:yes stop_codon:yes gene_type:complete